MGVGGRTTVAAALAVGALLLSGCGGDGGETIRVELIATLFDFSSVQSPVVGAEVCLERPIVGDCAFTDASGLAALDVPIDEPFLVRLTRDDLFPFLQPIPAQRAPVVIDFPVYPLGIVNAVAATLETEVDPAAGQITLAASPAQPGNAGETLRLLDAETGEEAPGDVFYVNADGFPDPRATGTPENGYSGFVNVPPGEYLVESAFNERCVVARGWETDTGGAFPVMTVPVMPGTVVGLQWLACAAP